MANQRPGLNVAGERGMALIAVLLLLLIMSALCATMTISGNTETLIARNHQVSTEAKLAAEAGVMHAAQLVIADLATWQTRYPTSIAALNDYLNGPDNLIGTAATDADNGSIAPLGGPAPTAMLALNGSPQIFYQVRLLDEDNPARGVTLTVPNNVGENTVADVDANRRIVIRAIGYAGVDSGGAAGSADAEAIVEATIAPIPIPAILSDGDLEITGNATINGAAGGVHTNSDLLVTGSADIEDSATATGDYDKIGGGSSVGAKSGGGKPPFPVNEVRAADYKPRANFILHADGTMTTVATGIRGACAGRCAGGWDYAGGSWSLEGVPTANMMYYFEGPATVTLGRNLAATLGIIAEGSIDITSRPDLTPLTDPANPANAASPWMVTDGDLQITGNMTVMEHAPHSQILVREQLSITGSATIRGQITVDNAASAFGLVTTSRVAGNSTITNNSDGSNSPVFGITAWRWGQ